MLIKHGIRGVGNNTQTVCAAIFDGTNAQLNHGVTRVIWEKTANQCEPGGTQRMLDCGFGLNIMC